MCVCGGGGGGGGHGRCEQRSAVFVKIQKKYIIIFLFFLEGGGVGLGGGGQDGCERRIKVFVKIQKKKFFFFLGGSGCGVRVDVNREVKFL